MNSDIHELLYHYNEDGYEGYDLNEVQLLRAIEIHRVEKLKLLLQHDDSYIAYQAMLILLARAIPEGFQQLDKFISGKWEEKHTFEPHRIYNEDNVYDVITNALSISILNGKSEEELHAYITRFLKIYGDHFFESHLKDFLIKKNCSPLLKAIEQAMMYAIDNERYYQASQLFPVIVRYDKDGFNKHVGVFKDLLPHDSRIMYNIEEAQKMIS